MQRWAFLAALVGSLLFAAAATACINDSESPKAEKEFKSRYQEVKPPAGSPSKPPESNSGDSTNQTVLLGGTGVGAALLIGAVGVTLYPRRRPRP
jgi:hypothetical protein